MTTRASIAAMATRARSESVGIGAASVTVVVALAPLFVVFGSGVLALAVAEVVITVGTGPRPTGTDVTMVKNPLAALAITAALHATVPLAPIAGVVHVHPAGGATEAKRSAASSRTDMLGLTASLGPPFVTMT